MRTTLALDDDAFEAIQMFARSSKLAFGKAASELIRRGARYQLPIRTRNGLPHFVVPDDFPVVTSEHSRRFLNEA